MKRIGLIIATTALAVLATAAVSTAQMGVAVMWEGGGIPSVMALPIMFGEGMVFQPMAMINWQGDDGPNPGTQIGLGASFEKQMGDADTKPLFGARAGVSIVSPKEGDSYTNFSLGVFLGGTAKLGDNLSIVGQWGPDVTIVGEKGSATGKSYASINSAASLTLRWWIWGNK
ncbi:MAG: hypothetical protein HZB43_07145 [candidate division Zixibacteria bacterium]|nr:hypothetical protein [candidate division Zixibacteria bacterium]